MSMWNLKYTHIGLVSTVFLASIGCASTPHQEKLHSTNERNLTVGVVQMEIHKGMDQATVAEALGAPNIVSKAKDGGDTWIYDKIPSEVSYSKSEGYGTLLLIGGSRNSGAAASTQKTLTVVIKFDANHLVDTFSYHSSTF